MHCLSACILLGAASASALAEMVQPRALLDLKGIMERQSRFCGSVPAGPNVCERACGPGYVTCISLPTCYNPSAGDTCCSNGKYCPAGSYCTDAGCCPNGTPLSACGAKFTLSVVPPPAATPTAVPPPASTPTALPPPPPETTSPPRTTETPPVTTSSPPPTKTRTPSSTTSTFKPPAVTAGAAQLGTNVLAGLGGLGAVLMAL